MNGKKIGIIVPIYKSEDTLRQCLTSILGQTYTNFELILVDDGSPDKSGEICEEYCKKDSRIHVIHKSNGGAGSARNIGLDYAFSRNDIDYITFIDSDDVVAPFYLEILAKGAFDKNAEMCVCDYLETECLAVPESKLNKDELCSVHVLSPEDLWIQNRILATVPWGKLYKKELWEDIRFPIMHSREDEYTVYKVLFKNKYLAISNVRLYYYYQSESSLMRTEWKPENLLGLEAYRQQLQYFVDNGYLNAACFTKKNIIITLAVTVGILRNNPKYKKQYLTKNIKELKCKLREYRGDIDLTISENEMIIKNINPFLYKIRYYYRRIFK